MFYQAETAEPKRVDNILINCVVYPKFDNYGWENMYKEYMSNVIKAIDIHSDISRLYLLIRFELTHNNLKETLKTLQEVQNLTQSPDAIQLTNNLKDIIPDADPIYLDLAGEYYVIHNDQLYGYIDQITSKKKTYPKIKEYNEHINHLAVVNRLRTSFSVQEFLKMCPDPLNYFKNIKSNSSSLHYNESLTYLSDR